MKHYKLIVKQSEVFNTLNQAMNLVENIFTTGKKITKRELDKANKILEPLNVHCWLSKGYISYLKMYAQDRSIKDDDGHCYVEDYERQIMLDSETGGVSADTYRHYKIGYPLINEDQAEEYIKQYNDLAKQIKDLEDKQRNIPYYWMMR